MVHEHAIKKYEIDSAICVGHEEGITRSEARFPSLRRFTERHARLGNQLTIGHAEEVRKLLMGVGRLAPALDKGSRRQLLNFKVSGLDQPFLLVQRRDS